MKKIWIFLLALTFVGAILLTYALWKLPPQTDTARIITKNIIIFSLGILLLFGNLLSFLIYGLRKALAKKQFLKLFFRQSLKEGFLLTIWGYCFLWLHKYHLDTIINIILLTLIFISFEVYLLLNYKNSLLQEPEPLDKTEPRLKMQE